MGSTTKGIPPETLQRIRDRIDMIDIVSRYVTLSKAGQNYKGLCPFHSEKTPSFTVNSVRQMFYCFGCGAGGDAFSFLMKHEGMGFMEAVRELGEQAGVTIVQDRSPLSGIKESFSRERYEHIHALAVSWFRDNLQSSQIGKGARDYLDKRGIRLESVETFGIGYASPGWNGLSRHLEKAGVTQEEMFKTGLVVKKDVDQRAQGQKQHHYDRFRQRIVFPISNLRGQVIAFGGRILEDEGTPKYLNSPETSYFSKGRSLYGLEKAREAASRLNRLLVVEGYFDVIALNQAGIKNAVAPLGTALTKDHINVLRRFVNTVHLVFDGDEAGMGAALRTLDLFINTGLTVKVLVLPSGDDPDTYIRSHGPEAFSALEEHAPLLLEYAVEACLKRQKADSVQDRVRCVDEVLRILQKVSNPIEKEEYAKSMSERLGIREQLLVNRYPTLSVTSVKKSDRAEKTKGVPSSVIVPKGRPEERDLVILLLQGKLESEHREKLRCEAFTEPVYRRIIEMGFRYTGSDGRIDLEALQSEALHDSELAPTLAQLTLSELPFEDIQSYIHGCLMTMERKHLQSTLHELIAKLRKAEQEQRNEEIESLNIQIDNLRGQKATLMTSSIPSSW